MEKLTFLIFVIMSAIIFVLMYNTYNLSSKISRLQKRYNTLVRGRGDIDFEELLRAHSTDIANSNTMINDMKKITDKINKEYGDSLYNTDKKIDSEINEIEDKFTQMYDGLDDKVSKELENHYEQIRSDLTKLEEDLRRNINILNDQLSFSIQKVGINKYDAFENQTGNLSFTIVLLDRFSNGIMITSINGREENYNYSKAIKNGEPEQEMSPEEEVALNMALGK